MSADNRAMPFVHTASPAAIALCPKRIVALVTAFAAALLFASHVRVAVADEPSGALRARYPAGSIDSTQRADAALAEAAGMRGRIERDFSAQAKLCAGRFMVNACLDEARENQRKRLADAEAVQLEADRFKRRDRNDRLEADRARRDAERTAGQPADSAARTRNREAYEERQATAARELGERAKSERSRAAAAARTTMGPGARTPRAPAPESGPSAAERAKNASAHSTKRTEAETHRQEIARRVAAKTADRKRRADEKAAKDARAAALARPQAAPAGAVPVAKP